MRLGSKEVGDSVLFYAKASCPETVPAVAAIAVFFMVVFGKTTV